MTQLSYPPEVWRRACAKSTERSLAKRAEPSPGLMPRGFDWLIVIFLLLIVLALGATYDLLWSLS